MTSSLSSSHTYKIQVICLNLLKACRVKTGCNFHLLNLIWKKDLKSWKIIFDYLNMVKNIKQKGIKNNFILASKDLKRVKKGYAELS